MNINNLLENIEINNNNKNIKLKELNNQENKLEHEQKSFLETNLGQTINWGINLGIRSAVPDLIEDEVIEIKNALIQEGFMRCC